MDGMPRYIPDCIPELAETLAFFLADTGSLMPAQRMGGKVEVGEGGRGRLWMFNFKTLFAEASSECFPLVEGLHPLAKQEFDWRWRALGLGL